VPHHVSDHPPGGSKRKIKPENSANHHQRLKRDPRRHTALDPALFGRGYSDCTRNLALCQTGSETSLPEFLADRRQGVASAPPTSIDSPLPCRHGASVPDASSHLIIWPLIAPFLAARLHGTCLTRIDLGLAPDTRGASQMDRFGGFRTGTGV
jgi:hypothetical protein